MDEILYTIGQINPYVLIGIAAVAVIAFVVSLVKRSVKMAVVLLLLAVLAGLGVPTVNNIRSSYGVAFDGVKEVLQVNAGGEKLSLNLKEIADSNAPMVRFREGQNSTYLDLAYTRKDGTSVQMTGKNAYKIPNFMVNALKSQLDSYGVAYESVRQQGALGE